MPYLDYNVVKAGFSMDDDLFIVNGWTKMPLREMAKKFLPNSVVWRKDKAGFPSPQEQWQRGELSKSFECLFSI